jgi:hypothetical protein
MIFHSESDDFATGRPLTGRAGHHPASDPRADRDVMAALVIGAVNQQAANANRVHFTQNDFFARASLAVIGRPISGSDGDTNQATPSHTQ